jgi:putative hydrolase of the HAD superfamily
MQPPGFDRCLLLLDAMGTLVKLEPPVEPLRRELKVRFGAGVSTSEAERAIAAEITYYRAHMDEGRDPAGVAALRARCAEALRETLPPSAGLRDVDGEALTEALLASLRFSAFPDASAALSSARARGQRVIVVSNWDSSLAQVLERVGLASLLDRVITSAEVGARKPAPAVFEAALAASRVTPAQALHVGDSLEEDVAGARAAGIAAVWLNRDGADTPPGVSMIRSLKELSEN